MIEWKVTENVKIWRKVEKKNLRKKKTWLIFKMMKNRSQIQQKFSSAFSFNFYAFLKQSVLGISYKLPYPNKA